MDEIYIPCVQKKKTDLSDVPYDNMTDPLLIY
jgi:hypothetical protein